jgi:hypothetical protein
MLPEFALPGNNRFTANGTSTITSQAALDLAHMNKTIGFVQRE